MHPHHKFKGSWYVAIMLGSIVLGELIAYLVSENSSLRLSPIVVAFLSAGVVALGAMVFFKDAEIG